MTHADEPAGGGSGVSHTRERLVAITLDERSISQANANVVHEREVAIYDILDQNMFAIEGRDDGPFTLDLSIVEDRLVFTVGTVKWYLHQIYGKLHVGNRTQAVAQARELKLII